MRENFANYLSDKEFNIQNILRTQKFKHWKNNKINKCSNELDRQFLKEVHTNDQ
jgi:hypothetical protein